IRDALAATLAAIAAARPPPAAGLQCMVMSMPDRAARAPPMNTLDEPVKISYMGGMPQHVGLRPMSPHRAAGLPLMSTCRQVPSITGPIGGSGVGGIGGGPLGGWATWACGAPRASEVRVAAGNAGSIADRALVAVASFSSRAPATWPNKAASGLATTAA